MSSECLESGCPNSCLLVLQTLGEYLHEVVVARFHHLLRHVELAQEFKHVHGYFLAFDDGLICGVWL